MGLSAESLGNYLALRLDWQISKAIHPLHVKTITKFYKNVIKPLAKTIMSEVDLGEALVTKVRRFGRIYVGEDQSDTIIQMAHPFNIIHVYFEQLYLIEITNILKRLSQFNGEDLTADEVDNVDQHILDANNQLLNLFRADAKSNYSAPTARR